MPLAPPELEAGAIVVRRDGTAPRFLLVTAKNNQSEWLFPKGHIEPGESAEAAAAREAREEAGVTASAPKRVGEVTYEHRGRSIQVEYFLLDFVREGDGLEGRKKEWLVLDDAARRLTFDSTRQMLGKVQKILAPSAQSDG